MIKFAQNKIKQKNNGPKWKIMIADDEVEVHNITRAVLSNFEFDNRNLEFISAYSGKEALELFKQHNDIGLVLLDVMMESDDAGLVVAKTIREKIHNHDTRIVLRTGQPGNFPEKEIILNYDINDYKEKTELTATKLFTTVVTALRAYKNIELLKQKQIQLLKQSKMAAMGEIMDAVAHQWKQPLGTILLSMDDLLLKSELDIELTTDHFKEVALISKRQINHLIETIDDFRKMFKGDLKRSTKSVKDIIDNTLLLLKDSLMQEHIEFIFKGDESVDINIALSEFKHILINLINNSKDELKSKNIEKKKIEFEWFKDNEKVTLLVKDNAGGIPEDIIKKVFEANFTTKEEGKGSGMGLYMSKMFSDKMGITIEASNTTQGACFSLKI